MRKMPTGRIIGVRTNTRRLGVMLAESVHEKSLRESTLHYKPRYTSELRKRKSRESLNTPKNLRVGGSVLGQTWK